MTRSNEPTAAAYAGDDLVFIIGCPRSGTTWLQRLLASHPLIATGQESHLFAYYIGPQLTAWRRMREPSASGRGGIGLGCYFDEPTFLAALRRYTIELLGPLRATAPAGGLFVEKTPDHALHVADIHALLPRARFIHLLRDPRDVTASMLAASRSWGAGWAPRRARAAAQKWVRLVQAARTAGAALPPDRFLEVRYEALVTAPSTALGAIATFLGVEWTAAAIAAAVQRNAPARARAGDGTPIPIGGIFATATGEVQDPPDFIRRAQVGTWRQDLRWWQRIAVQRVAGDTMRECGYGGRTDAVGAPATSDHPTARTSTHPG